VSIVFGAATPNPHAQMRQTGSAARGIDNVHTLHRRCRVFRDIITSTNISRVSGQRDILESILRFAEEKEEEAVEEAQKLGIELEFE
jgi:hypothetical protein